MAGGSEVLTNKFFFVKFYVVLMYLVLPEICKVCFPQGLLGAQIKLGAITNTTLPLAILTSYNLLRGIRGGGNLKILKI